MCSFLLHLDVMWIFHVLINQESKSLVHEARPRSSVNIIVMYFIFSKNELLSCIFKMLEVGKIQMRTDKALSIDQFR